MMIPIRSLATLICLSLLPTASALAQQSGPAAMAGTWLLAKESGGKGCTLLLEEGPTIGGFAISGTNGCRAVFPAMVEAYAWEFEDKGTIVLRDIGRQTLARMTPKEDGSLFEAKPPADRAGDPLRMVRATSSGARLPRAADIVATWQLQRPGGPVICTVTFTAAGAAFKVATAPGCDPAIAKLKLVDARWEGSLFILSAPGGGSLSFEPNDKGFGKAAREGGRPLLMVRKP
jgi:hypothetical protein